MTQIKITIATDNAAFEDSGVEIETARILRELSNKLSEGDRPEKLRDLNGNVVGSVEYD